jgi:hypothetical protein
VTDSSTYELGKTLTWGSIRADVECRASYASGIIGGTHVPQQEHTHGCSELFFPGLPILPRGQWRCRGGGGQRLYGVGGGHRRGHWQGKADSSRPGCRCAAEGAGLGWVVEAARSRRDDGDSWTTGTAPQWGRQTGWRHLRMAWQSIQ